MCDIEKIYKEKSEELRRKAVNRITNLNILFEKAGNIIYKSLFQGMAPFQSVMIDSCLVKKDVKLYSTKRL